MTAGTARHGAEIRKVLWITLALNVVVAGAKIAVGAATSTLSVLADGYHSLLDGSGNIVGLIAIKFAHKPPDDDHHYGHRKFEVLASMVISLVLFATAFEIVATALSRLHGEGTPDPRPVTFVTILVTLAVNIFVTTYESRRGRELGSPFLIADARHTLSDVLASCGVLVAIICVRLGLPWADPLAAVLIGVVIVRAGYRILVSGLDVIADRSVIDAARIEAAVLENPGVTACARIRTRGFPDSVFLDLTVAMDPDLSLEQAHALCDGIEERLRTRFPELADIVIHPEPASRAPAAAKAPAPRIAGRAKS